MKDDEPGEFKKLFSTYKLKQKESCKEFLSGRKNIFTLNYDPLLYFEILKLGENNYFNGFVSSKDKGIDGCKVEYVDSTSQEYIICKLERETRSHITKVFFLHGSWFIQAEEDKLRKLSFNEESSDSIDSLFKDGKRPYLILEDRSRMKKVWVSKEGSIYFNYCYESLKKIEGDLLIFGCSFANDDHILDALSENKNLGTVSITYYEKDDNFDKKKIEEKLKDKKLDPIPVADNVIWS